MYRKQNTTAKYFVLFECAPRQNFLSSYEKKKYLRACNILCKHSGPKYIWGAFANDFKSMFVHPPNPSMSGTQKKGKKCSSRGRRSTYIIGRTTANIENVAEININFCVIWWIFDINMITMEFLPKQTSHENFLELQMLMKQEEGNTT